MANPFDQFDAPVASGSNPFDQFDDKPKVKEPGLARSAADTALAGATGLVSGVQMLSNVAGADNPVSRGLGKANEFLADLESPYRKAEKQERAKKIKAAEESGSTWEEVKAYAGAFGEAPLDTTVNALGTSVPTLAAAFLTGGASVPAQVAARALPKVIGVAQGTGAVKGQIYEAVEQEHLKAGKTPEEAAAIAAKAQAYDGKNVGQIALGGVFGGVASGIGAEAAIRRFVSGKVAGEAGKDAAMGIGKAAGLGVLKETPVEMLQGGQERVASNLALQNEGFDTPTWQGVAGQAALEGLASAPMGAGFGMLDARGLPTVNPNTAVEPPAQPPAPAAEQPPAPFVNPASLTGNNAAALLGSQGAGLTGAADPLRAVVTPSQAMGIDPNAGAISRVAAEAVDGPASMEMAVRQAERDMAALAAEDNPEAGADPLTAAPDPLIAQVAGYVGEMGTASPQMVAAKFGVTTKRAAELLAQADPTVDDLFPPPQGAANVSNADAAGALAAGVGGPVGSDTAGSGPDAGLLATDAGQRPAGTAGTPAPAVQESVAAPVSGRDSDKALKKGPTQTKAKVKGLKDVIARNKAAKANVQNQPQGTAPAAAPAPAEAVQAPQAVGSDGAAQPGAAPAGNPSVEADGVASKKQEFKVEGADPHTVSYAQRPDGRLVRTINYPDGQSSTDTLVTDKKGDETWVSDDRYAKGEFYPKQLSSADAEQAIREDMAGKPVAPTPSPTTTEPTNGTQTSEAIPQETGREETALLSDSVKPAGKYQLPEGRVSDSWRDSKKRGTDHPDYEPTPRQQVLMDEVAKAKDAGAFYANDVKDAVAKALGVDAETLAANTTGVEGGDFGYDVYLAGRAVDAKRKNAREKEIAKELSLKPGDKLGTLVFNDMKVTNSVEVESVSDDGLSFNFKGKRGPVGVKFSTGPVNVKGAIERAHEKGKRKDTYGQFIEARKAPAAPAVAAPAPSQQAQAPAEPQETTHNGTRIYRTRAKLGDEVKTMWAVETPENKARRAAGERALGGDTLHDTIEQAKAAADREAKQYADRKAFAEKQDAEERARKEADEARKASNRGKSILERRKDAILDGDTKLPASAGLGNTTRRNAMQMAVEQGRAVVERQVDDTAAKKRDQEAIERVRRAGYMLGLSNENIPVVKAGLEAQARLKANDYKKPEYRVYAGSEPTGGFFEITKIEYEYAQELMAQKAVAPVAAPAPEPATQADEFLPEGWTKSINGYTKRPVYRMEQGGGQPFAVVTQTEGMTYEVQIRHGDKQLTTSTQRGALSEVLAGAKAELAKMTQASSVTHQDPGEKPEAATKGVVTDSLKTAAKNEDTDFIPAPDGGLDYGEITPEMSKIMRRQAGKIRLRQGNEAWGLTHIEARHGEQFKTLGFQSAQDFIAQVAGGFNAIYKGSGSGLSIVLETGRTGGRLMVQLEPSADGDFYDVKTASPIRSGQYKNEEPLWRRAGTSAPTAQGSSLLPRDQSGKESVPQPGQEAQADAPKLTQAEAKDLMEWQDLGQKDGIKTHILTFYESRADKDANRGRMVMATVTKEAAAKQWVVEATGERLTMLGAAKKKAEVAGMARAVADGFVEPVAAAPDTPKKGLAGVRAKKAAEAEAQRAPTATSEVENFGEKLPPARRNMAAKLSEALSDDNIAKLPLSQIWPASENEAIEDTFAAAVAHVMREAIPAKPRTAYKVNSWVNKVKMLRDFAAKILRGTVTKDFFMEEMAKFSALRDLRSKIKLLEQIDREQWKRIGDVSEAPNAMRYEEGKPIPSPSVSVSVDGKNHWLRGSGDVLTHLDAIKAMLGTDAPENKMQFEIRQESRGERKVFINKKGDKEYRRLMEFATVDEARKAIREQYADLVAAWEGVKARDNITERDLRSDTNRERAGKDHRQGRDVTAEEFEKQFGFRGGEFGKWVGQGKGAQERQFMLNSAYDALMDLSDLLGIPPKAISLEGSLGIAFGSRGSGWASAHFEPSNLVINLTKTRGAGALAHEWFHALDNYFARKRGGEVPFDGDNNAYRRNNYVTYKTTPLMVRKDGRGTPVSKERLAEWRKTSQNAGYLAEDQWIEDPNHKQGVRAEVEQAFSDLVKTLNDSPMLKRAQTLDGVGRNSESDGYWSRVIERAARAFENYVQTRMMEQGYHNDFLANVKVADEVGKNTDRYPYLLPSEIAPVADAFKALFDTIQTKEDDAGNVALFSQGLLSPASLGPKPTPDQIQGLVDKMQQVAKNTLPVTVTASPSDIPGLKVPAGAKPSGALIGGRIYLFADNLKSTGDAYVTLFHELFHLGLQKVIPAEDYAAMLAKFSKNLLVQRFVREWKASPEGVEKASTMPAAAYDALAAEEALAMVSEELAANNGIGTRNMPGLAKSMLSWLSSVADRLGFPPSFSDWMRGLTRTDAEKFVSDMVRAAMGGEKNLGRTRTRYGTELAQMTEQSRLSAGDAGSPDIRFRSTPRELAGMATEQLKMTLTAPGKLSWWSKTVGTMYGLAERHPAFKPVFNAAQSFIDDVSYYATDAADMAPKMLPKLENWRDIAKSPISAEDNKAIEAPINEGTLLWARDESGRPVKVAELEAQAADMTADQKARRLLRNDKINEGVLKMWQGLPQEQYEKLIESRYQSQMLTPGVVWTDAELKAIWKLNDTQIGLYREVRSAIDKSLDNLAKSDLVRFVGKDGAGIKDAIMEAGSVDEAALMARDYFIGLAEAEPDRAEMLLATANGIMDRADKVTRLKEQGYAPLSRFGKYTVDVVTEEGRQYFGLFESMREANQMAARMRGEFGKDAVSQGTLSDESFKLFQGITPETLELFGNMLGLSDTGDTPQDQAFQAYLKLTKNNRSAMKRLIQRKGILGYSQDVGRVLANFIYSNARQTASALHIGDLTDAINAIPQGQGEVKDVAVKLGEYIKNPQEEAQAFRGLLFAQYLGGNISSTIINALQPFQVSFPYLSQFGGVKQAGAEMLRATREYATGKKNYEPDLAKALKNAEDDGTVSPQEVFQLMAQAKGAGTLRSGDGTVRGELLAKGGNAWAKTAMAWGKVFGVAEQFNRRTTFIAAYRIAKAQKMADPAAFAKKAVQETQFIYSKANRPQWARGAIGATIFTFKTYSISYLELLHRMATQGGPEGKRAALLAVAVLLLMGGAGGLPFMEDGEDIADTIAQVMGYNFSSKQAKQELLEELFGEAAAQFIERGISGVAGVPIDVSGRFGMGNLVPGTGAFLQRNSNARDVLEVLGPAGDLARRGQESVAAFLKGDLKQSAYALSPRAIYNMAKGGDMLNTGMYRDDKGFKVIEATTGEGVLKAIGFQPNSVAKVQEANYLMQRQKDYYNATAQSIRAKWARGLFEKDDDMVAEARDAIDAWNEKNPDQRMSPNMPAIWRRVREMAKDKDQRIADTAPKAMRQQFREETARVREAL